MTSAMELRRAVEMWRGTHDGSTCPTVAQLKNDKALDKGAKAVDEWGREFQIRCEEDDTFVTSLGADGRPSADDIVVPARDAKSP